MKPFTKILVPVDFSQHSTEATRYAVDLSRRYDAPITLLHVFQPVAYALPEGYVLHTPEQIGDMLSTFEKHLQAAKTEAQPGLGPVHTKLLQGSAFVEIVNFAKEGDFDLIVLGTHGRSAFTQFLLGSVAEKVVRKAPCPVLTVRLPDAEDAGR